MSKKILIILFVVVNIFCFARIGIDKRLAENGNYGYEKNINRRMAEVSLISYSAFGGAIGSLIGFKVFNHKTSSSKSYLRHNMYIILLENIILYLALYFNIKKRKE